VRRLALAALLAAAALPARPDVIDHGSGPSPRWGSFQLSFSTLQPDIDAGPFGPPTDTAVTTTPYATVFGTGKPLLTQLLFSRSVWMTVVGSLDVGAGIGFWKATGTGICGPPNCSSPQPGGSSSLTMLPVQVAVGYRFDVFFEQWGVPLAPYLRGAIIDDIWWTSGQGSASSSWPANSSGGTFGWAATFGLAFVLDALDPSMARQMDYDTGINHTLLFFDFTKESVNNFGSKNSWQLAPSYWMWSAGILFVF